MRSTVKLAVADGDEVPGVQASSLNGKSRQTSASRIFCMDGGILDKIYRITEFFGWGDLASQARVCVGFTAYSVPLLGELALLRGASAAAMLPMVKTNHYPKSGS